MLFVWMQFYNIYNRKQHKIELHGLVCVYWGLGARLFESFLLSLLVIVAVATLGYIIMETVIWSLNRIECDTWS